MSLRVQLRERFSVFNKKHWFDKLCVFAFLMMSLIVGVEAYGVYQGSVEVDQATYGFRMAVGSVYLFSNFLMFFFDYKHYEIHRENHDIKLHMYETMTPVLDENVCKLLRKAAIEINDKESSVDSKDLLVNLATIDALQSLGQIVKERKRAIEKEM